MIYRIAMTVVAILLVVVAFLANDTPSSKGTSAPAAAPATQPSQPGKSFNL
jgi:hypothetical protein